MTHKYLVTGGNGFIGRSLIEKLLEQDSYVRVLDNYSRSSMNEEYRGSKNLDYICGDVRNSNHVLDALKDIDSVIHLAAINGTVNFYSKPTEVLEVAAKGIINLVESCIQKNIRDFVFVSSSEVYGSPDTFPTPEEAPLKIANPLNPRFSYSGGKIFSEIWLLNFAKEYFNRAVIVRPHNIYGPNMGFDHVIPQFVFKLWKLAQNPGAKKVLKIEGSGLESRSFMFIDDFTNGLMSVINSGDHLNIYNLGTIDEIKILDLASKVATIMGIEVSVETTHLSQGSPMRRCPDISKVKSLGHRSIVNLDLGLRKTIDWYVQYFENKDKNVRDFSSKFLSGV